MNLCVFMFCVYVLVFFDFITFFVVFLFYRGVWVFCLISFVFVSFLFYVLWHFLFLGDACFVKTY